MNIFAVHSDPVIAAQSLVDKHVIKMILESAQLLSTAHRIIDGIETPGFSKSGRYKVSYELPDVREQILYSATHINHPCAIWCRQTVDTYKWLYSHTVALSNEYTHRYGKLHKCAYEVIPELVNVPTRLSAVGLTKFVCVMDQKYIISDDPVTNYRNYYKLGKKDLFSWKQRSAPEWTV